MEINKGFEINSNAVIEEKLTTRINDVITALTRQMADRHETKKSIRVLEK